MSNTDLSTLQWMEGQSHAAPDFNINHQCRDFDALLEWRKENSVDMGMWKAMKKPEDAVVVTAQKEYDTIDDGDVPLIDPHGGHDRH